MLRVRDIMTRYVVTLRAESPLFSAEWTFASEGVSGAPVRDAGRLVGVLSKTDLVDPLRGTQRRGATIGDAMNPFIWSVHPADPAMHAVNLMVKLGIHRVLVVGRPGELLGIITPLDVLRALSRGQLIEPEAPGKIAL